MVGRLTGLICVAVLASGLVVGAASALNERGGGPDRLVGSKGPDRLKGMGGNDLLVGGAGSDILIGGRGADVLRGGPGRDSFNMRNGVEVAAPGRDRIDARDGGQDSINCGAGRDRAIVDAFEDGVYNCEKVKEP